MHVWLNLLFLVPGETGGMEVYARELIPELAAAAPQTRFTAFINREASVAGGGPWNDLIESVTVPVNARRRVEWVRGEQQLIPPLAARLGVDLVHSLASTAPVWGRFRRVVTIHDLNYRIVPEAHLGVLGFGMRLLVPLASRRSHRIIVPARASRDDLVRFLNVPSEKIDIVHEGVGASRRARPMPETELRAQLQAGDRPIVLSVSAKRPHKNLARLLGALARIPLRPRPLLVLPGYPTEYEQELRHLASQLRIEDDVRFLGWIDASELEGLYAAASCFVFPSLYEGFGLPVLEAMARGVPVACSGRGALDEVAGAAALRFNPESEADIGAAIERLLSDPSEAERLRRAGYEQATRFTWTAAARGTLASYERALSADGAGSAGAA
jgi:glycosyltransferase involved in cell wall biosynthesis